jgi:hypothetical protein
MSLRDGNEKKKNRPPQSKYGVKIISGWRMAWGNQATLESTARKRRDAMVQGHRARTTTSRGKRDHWTQGERATWSLAPLAPANLHSGAVREHSQGTHKHDSVPAEYKSRSTACRKHTVYLYTYQPGTSRG